MWAECVRVEMKNDSSNTSPIYIKRCQANIKTITSSKFKRKKKKRKKNLVTNRDHAEKKINQVMRQKKKKFNCDKLKRFYSEDNYEIEHPRPIIAVQRNC